MMVGIFGYLNGATIKNLVIEDFDLTYSALFMGVLSSYSLKSRIINCHIQSSSNEKINNLKNTGPGALGAFCGYSLNSSFVNCSLTNTFVTGDGMVIFIFYFYFQFYFFLLFYFQF